MNVPALLSLYLREQRALIDLIENSDFLSKVEQAFELIWNTYENQGTVFACGNGGNAGVIGNFICDISRHPFVEDDKSKSSGHRRLRAIDLTSSSAALTGAANDFGYDKAFGELLIDHHVGEHDLVVGFSGSGNSGNVLYALETARKASANTLCFTGRSGGKALKNALADVIVLVPGSSDFPGQTGPNDNNFHIEDTWVAASHMVTGLMRARVRREISLDTKGVSTHV